MTFVERFLEATENIENCAPVDPWLGHGMGGVDTNLYRTVRELCQRVKALEDAATKYGEEAS